MRTRSWALAVAISAAANVGFLVVLALGGRPERDYGPSRAIEVQLSMPALPAARPQRAMTAPARTVRQPAPPEPPPPPTVASPPPPQSIPSEPAAPTGSLAAALRRGLACDHADLMQLTPTERQRCRDRLAAASDRAAETAGLGLDPGKQAIFDLAAKRDHVLQEPFLAEKPKNGCRPRVTEQNIPVHASAPQDWRLGVSCGIQF